MHYVSMYGVLQEQEVHVSTIVGAYSLGSIEKSHLYFFVRWSLNCNPFFTSPLSISPLALSRLEKNVCKDKKKKSHSHFNLISITRPNQLRTMACSNYVDLALQIKLALLSRSTAYIHIQSEQ